MYKIYLDTSDRYTKLVQLLEINSLEESKVLFSRSGEIDVVSAMSEVLHDAQLTVADVTAVEFYPGPGSFTGLKIGAAIANVFNWANGSRKSSQLMYPEYGREPNITEPKKH